MTVEDEERQRIKQLFETPSPFHKFRKTSPIVMLCGIGIGIAAYHYYRSR